MKVVVAQPPNYAAIVKAFPTAGRSTIFAYGDTIYNPGGGRLGPELVAHEAAHGARQGTGPAITLWWQRYIDEPAFRLAEEIIGHRAEYRVRVQGAANRHQRRSVLKDTVRRLLHPLYRYGGLITPTRAAEVIENG